MRRWFGPPAADAAPLWRDGALALAAGVAHTAAFAPQQGWWLQVLALAGLLGIARDATPRRAAALGWLFGLGWLASGLWWLYISLHQFGHLAAPLAAGAVLLLAAVLALYTAAALALWAVGRRYRLLTDALLWAACWLGAELARAQAFSGFPWLASGYAHTDGPLAAWAPWIGVYGIGALAALAAALLAGLASRRVAGGWRQAAPALALLAALGLDILVLPQDFTRSTGRLSVSLVQPAVPQELKFDPERLQANLDQVASALEAARGALVVTPESVVPLPLAMLAPEYGQRLVQAVAAPGRAALVGVFLGDDQQGYVNSLIGIQAGDDPAGGRFYRYGKRHLLPFGEIIPPGFHWFVRALAIPLDDQARGDSQAPFVVAGQRLRPLICYEDLFGEDFVASVVGPESATVLVNASNLAWFGTVMVQDQHLQFSRMRALEFQRPVVRATNTGATAVVDHRGVVTARLPPAVAATLEAQVEGRQGDTPYARWLAGAGLAPLWALVLLGLAGLGWRRR